MDSELAGTLDAVAARAVPPWMVENVDGWLARHSPGLATKRVNSVWARQHDRGSAIETKLASVERFYADRDLPARFQVSPAAQPAGLDRALERRGYQVGAQTSVELCDLRMLGGLRVADGIEIAVGPVHSPEWLATWQASLMLNDARLAASVRLFGRLPARVAFVTVSVDQTPAGVALGVLDGRWLGIFNMATLPARRRCGIGRAALGALAGWARPKGAEVGYLQVDLDNAPARGLYRGVGFETAYHYAYRTLDP